MSSNDPQVFGVKEEVAAWAAATDKVREVAKWIAASFGALGALLIGTAPLTGFAKLDWSWALVAAILGGAAAIGSVAFIVWRTTSLLSPRFVTIQDVEDEPAFASLRTQIAADPSAYLGSWGTDVASFISNRDLEYVTLSGLDQHLQTGTVTPTQREALQSARKKQVARIATVGQVTSRLLAIADFHDISREFRRARTRLFWAGGLSIIGIVMFVIAVGSKEAESTAIEPQQVPALVTLTDSGRDSLGSVLGDGCPDPFQALILSGGAGGPWQVLVVEDDCVNGMISLSKDQASVLLIFDPGDTR